MKLARGLRLPGIPKLNCERSKRNRVIAVCDVCSVVVTTVLISTLIHH
jgi:hypothetical protein